MPCLKLWVSVRIQDLTCYKHCRFVDKQTEYMLIEWFAARLILANMRKSRLKVSWSIVRFNMLLYECDKHFGKSIG